MSTKTRAIPISGSSSTDGQTQKQLTSAGGKSSSPKWSPDGKSIAFTAKRNGDEQAQIYVIPPFGGEARRMPQLPSGASGIKWGHDSKTIYAIVWTWPDTPNDDAYHKREKDKRRRSPRRWSSTARQFRYWDQWLTDGKRPHVFAIDVAAGMHTIVGECRPDLAAGPAERARL